MSIELVLIPVGIAVFQSLSSFVDRQTGEWKVAKTVMKRKDLLEKALAQYGCEIRPLEENNYQTEIGDVQILFQENEEGLFEAVFHEKLNDEEVEEFLQNIETEYKYLIQQETYEKLMTKAREHGLILESEEREKDRSIVLTFNVTNKNQ